MPIINFRSIVVLAATLTFLASHSVASPAPPLSLGTHSVDPPHELRTRRIYGLAARHRGKSSLGLRRRFAAEESRDSSTRLVNRDSSQDPVASLKPSYNKMVSSSKQLSANAAVASSKSGDKAFQQQNSDAMSDFQGGLLEFQGLLSQLAADKGLANYDSGDKLETMLKNVVNATKNTLSATDILVYRIPVLGPILGPIVYQVKCIVDDVLDATENLTDGLLNDLAPLLRGLDNQTVDLLCGPLLGIPIPGASGLCPQS